jgi:glucose uptake protein GlcU
MQVVYTLVGVVCGGIFFQEWKDMGPFALGMYAVGFVGMGAGIRVSISAQEIAQGLQEMEEQEQAALAALERPSSMHMPLSLPCDCGPAVSITPTSQPYN